MKIFTTAVVIFSLFVGHLTYAQVAAVITPNQFQAKAETAYDKQDYNAALANYMSILTDDPNRSDLYWRAAECARYTRHFKTAEFYYEAFAKKPELSNTEPLLFFKLAGIKKNLEKYDAAIALYQKYVSSENTKIAEEALSEINQLKWAKSKLEDKKTYEVERLKENVQVNTIYIDAAPVQYGSTLYYTTGYVKTPESAEGGSNVYTSNLVTAPKMSIVTNVFSSNLKDKPLSLAINSQADNVHTAYYAPNTEGSRLYYNLCEQTENASFNCKIYVREKGADGSWANPKKLGSNINMEGFTSTQPNVGFDSVKGKDVLYFVSDRKGGKGGLDIWTADIEADGTVNAPVNFPLNTQKDDVTPFFMNGPQILMFSTDGDSLHSFGGFDIFKSQKSAIGFGERENIGYPMNSSYDDMYASFTPENAKYYFVSNRPGGLCGSEKKDCVCNDIYEEYIKATLDVSTFLADGGKALTGCLVNLVDAETGKLIKEDMNANSNDFKFAIEPNKKYRLIASKKGYMPDTLAFNTLGLYQPVTAISQRLTLKPNLKMEIYVFDRIDRKPIDGALVKIRSDVDSSIVYASETLKGNLMTWSGLEFGKTYRISAFKDNFGEDNKKELIGEWSSTITKFVYKDSLYLTPFSGLPLTLYYDNDNPDPRSRKMTTIYTYGETFASYYAKQAEYLNGFYKDNRDISSNGANEISEFFEKEIKFGYDKLNNFSTKLIKYLQNGKGMEIVLEGYASPLAETEYNRILTSRRVSAVINHFYKYNSGLFRPYIKNGQLRLRVEPYGEDKAKGGTSDDANDRRQSVYSVAAMSERKVKILQINVFDYDYKTINGSSFNQNLGIYLDRDDLGLPKPIVTLEEVEMENRKGSSSSRKRKGKTSKTTTVVTSSRTSSSSSSRKRKGKTYTTTSSNESNINAIYGTSSSNMSTGGSGNSSSMSMGSGSSSSMSTGSGSSSSMSTGSSSGSSMSMGSSSSSSMSMGSGSSSSMSTGSGSSSSMSTGSGSSSSMSMGSSSSSSTDANINEARKAMEAKMAKAAADELAAKAAQELALSKTKMSQQRHEIVLVDTYTGELINNEASVELFEQSSNQMLSKAKRSGKSYYFNVDVSKDYIIKGSVDGYSESTVTKYKPLNTEGVLSMTTDTMYLTPFSGLPLALYFDNDKPAGTAEATTTTYEATYRPFVARKREFISSYNKIMGDNGGIMGSDNSMNSFFDNDIKGGYDRLVGFSNILKSYLQRGNQIEIIVEGYASPLANSEYNQRLSVRRVNSVVNHFSGFAGGALKKYITSGQLKITIQSHGEVSPNVSDDIKNMSSIYSLEASRERKVVIKDIVILNNSFFKK